MDCTSSMGAGCSFSAGLRTILVVDDEILLRLSIADEFRAYGYAVVEAANADEALSILQSGTVIHAVFTDVRMPGSMYASGKGHGDVGIGQAA